MSPAPRLVRAEAVAALLAFCDLFEIDSDTAYAAFYGLDDDQAFSAGLDSPIPFSLEALAIIIPLDAVVRAAALHRIDRFDLEFAALDDYDDDTASYVRFYLKCLAGKDKHLDFEYLESLRWQDE